jgi:hypothetical protein
MEPSVNLRSYKVAALLICATFLLLSACAPSSDSTNSIDEVSFTDSASAAEQSQQATSVPNEMVTFQGTVFVATSDVIAQLWQEAGWRLSDVPVDTDAGDVPVDCSLHPHLGVANQWVGSCGGTVRVPKYGAQHIAAMVTGEDGSVTMIQVAPDPGNSAP